MQPQSLPKYSQSKMESRMPAEENHRNSPEKIWTKMAICGHQTLLSILAAASAAGTIYVQYFGSRQVGYILKPLTMSLVIGMASIHVSRQPRFYGKAILAGLLFSLGGDIFLMQSGYFQHGLFSFLIAHLWYLAAFVQGHRFRVTLQPLLIFILYGIAMLGLLWPGLGADTLPVIFYILVILMMGHQACERWLLRRTNASRQALIGAILFIFSDSVLALNRFRTALALAPLLILGSYFTAQWFLAQSIREVSETRPAGGLVFSEVDV
jgi:uncharacterized membrane protein YhhN